jgi:hypothetical protein
MRTIIVREKAQQWEISHKFMNLKWNWGFHWIRGATEIRLLLARSQADCSETHDFLAGLLSVFCIHVRTYRPNKVRTFIQRKKEVGSEWALPSAVALSTLSSLAFLSVIINCAYTWSCISHLVQTSTFMGATLLDHIIPDLEISHYDFWWFLHLWHEPMKFILNPVSILLPIWSSWLPHVETHSPMPS